MVRCRRIRDPKSNRHHIEKRFGTGRTKIILNEKAKFVLPGVHLVSAEQRLIGPAIGIGHDRLQRLTAGLIPGAPKLDLHARGRPPDAQIQDVSAQFSRH